MSRKNLLMRLFRAISGDSQKQFALRTGVHHVTLAQIELGQAEPSPDYLERSAQGAGLTVAAGEQILELADALRERRRRQGLEVDDLSSELSSVVLGVYRRLLRLPLPVDTPRDEDRQGVAAQWSLLAELSEDQQLAVVRLSRVSGTAGCPMPSW
jgi:transcriptional regulator with XRE-family HTH domain